MMKFTRPTVVRKFANARGRKVTKDFLTQLEHHIARTLDRACTIHNGGRKIMDGEFLLTVITHKL